MNRRPSIALASALVLPAVLARPAPAQEAVPPPPRPVGLPEPAKGEAPAAAVAPPTEPTRVALDFPSKPIAQVIRTLAGRTRGMIDTFNTNDARWSEPTTLSSPGPVPFWEAVDRLTAAANLSRWVSQAGPLSVPRPHVQFSANLGPTGAAESAADEGLVAYVGPFRVGPVAIHERVARTFHPPAAPTFGPPPAPTFHAEIALMAEPDLLAVQVGPIRRVEAVDAEGRSLLDPKLGGEVPLDPAPAGVNAASKLVRIPMARPPGPRAGVARTLRAAVPLEVARRPVAPALDVPLEGSTGKTFREGDLSVTVREYRAGPGAPSVKLTLRPEGRPGEPARLADSRLWVAFTDLVELADARGNPVHVGNGGGGPSGSKDGRREMALDYTFVVTDEPGRGLPTRLRIYRPEWVAWDLPLEFHDVPLP